MHDPADANAELSERLAHILIDAHWRLLDQSEIKDLAYACGISIDVNLQQRRDEFLRHYKAPTLPTTTKEPRHEPA